MGRTPHNKRAGANHTVRRKDEPSMIDFKGLRGMWFAGDCQHTNSVVLMNGPYVTTECRDCGTKMQFLLLFGRPKSFEVYLVKDGQMKLLGRASTDDVCAFTAMPEFELVSLNAYDDPDNAAPEWSSELYCRVVDAMCGDEPYEDDDDVDRVSFAGLWNGGGCKHKDAFCWLYGTHGQCSLSRLPRRG